MLNDGFRPLLNLVDHGGPQLVGAVQFGNGEQLGDPVEDVVHKCAKIKKEVVSTVM